MRNCSRILHFSVESEKKFKMIECVGSSCWWDKEYCTFLVLSDVIWNGRRVILKKNEKINDDGKGMNEINHKLPNVFKINWIFFYVLKVMNGNIISIFFYWCDLIKNVFNFWRNSFSGQINAVLKFKYIPNPTYS